MFKDTKKELDRLEAELLEEEEWDEIWSECMPTISAKIRKLEYER